MSTCFVSLEFEEEDEDEGEGVELEDEHPLSPKYLEEASQPSTFANKVDWKFFLQLL